MKARAAAGQPVPTRPAPLRPEQQEAYLEMIRLVDLLESWSDDSDSEVARWRSRVETVKRGLIRALSTAKVAPYELSGEVAPGAVEVIERRERPGILRATIEDVVLKGWVCGGVPIRKPVVIVAVPVAAREPGSEPPEKE